MCCRPCWWVACAWNKPLICLNFKSLPTQLNERHYGHVSPSPSSHCSAPHYASRLMLQGAGLRRRQVTRISIKGIIDVGTAERKNNTFMDAFGAKACLRISSRHIKMSIPVLCLFYYVQSDLNSGCQEQKSNAEPVHFSAISRAYLVSKCKQKTIWEVKFLALPERLFL